MSAKHTFDAWQLHLSDYHFLCHTDGALKIKLRTNSGIDDSSTDGLIVKAANGIEVTSSGVGVKLATGSGLAVSASGLTLQGIGEAETGQYPAKLGAGGIEWKTLPGTIDPVAVVQRIKFGRGARYDLVANASINPASPGDSEKVTFTLPANHNLKSLTVYVDGRAIPVTANPTTGTAGTFFGTTSSDTINLSTPKDENLDTPSTTAGSESLLYISQSGQVVTIVPYWALKTAPDDPTSPKIYCEWQYVAVDETA